MSQTSYDIAMAVSFDGMLVDSTDNVIDSKRNSDAGEVKPGIAVAQGTAAADLKLVAAAADKLLGIIPAQFARNNRSLTNQAAYASGDQVPVVSKGRVWVKVEENVALGDDVYVRFAAKAGNTQKGAFRRSADGVAEVHTVTPTAADAKIYVLRVEIDGKFFTFEYISDGSGTATEVCDGLRTLMAADAEFTALIVGSGTATLILTGQTAGKAFIVHGEGDGVLADVTTTPAAATAVKAKGFRFLTAATAGNLAQVECSAIVAQTA